MIKGGAGAGNINDLIHWYEGGLFTCFLPFMYDVKAASPVLAILEQQLHIATVLLFFLIQCLNRSSPSHLAWKRQIFLDIFYQM